jgi:hypothetical protein
MARTWLTLGLLMLCAGCSHPEPVAVRTVVPPYLLTCGDRPTMPELLTEGWVLQTVARGLECWDHLAKVRGLLQ